MTKWSDRARWRAAWHTLRTQVLNRERLQHAITHNLSLKLLSVVIAFGLWLFVNFGERDTEESLKVPLELRNVPAHLMITSPRVDFVDLRVMGPRTLLGRIDRNQLAVPLDLRGVRPGQAVFRVGTDALSLPRGVKVVRITPAEVSIALERVKTKTLPVHLRVTGQPAENVRIIEIKVSPETVQVTGPESDLRELQAVNTEAIDVSAAAPGTIDRELPLETLGDYLSCSATRVAVQLRVEELPVTREFTDVPVLVRNGGADVRVKPEEVRLTVRGARELIHSLELAADAVSVDASGIEGKDREVTPEVSLPAGVDLVSLEPPRVRVSRVVGRTPSRRRR
jgi:YbbR domain-containing protein